MMMVAAAKTLATTMMMISAKRMTLADGARWPIAPTIHTQKKQNRKKEQDTNEP